MPLVYGPNWHYMKPSEQPTTFECHDCKQSFDIRNQRTYRVKRKNGNCVNLHVCPDCFEVRNKPKYLVYKLDNKHCSKCNRQLPVSEFYKREERRQDGRIYKHYSTYCMSCTKEAKSAKYREQKQQELFDFVETKTCKRCGIEQPVESFYFTDGYRMNVCKTCYNKKSAENRKSRIAKNPNYEHERYLRKIENKPKVVG